MLENKMKRRFGKRGMLESKMKIRDSGGAAGAKKHSEIQRLSP
jgi:hypothetical protein